MTAAAGLDREHARRRRGRRSPAASRSNATCRTRPTARRSCSTTSRSTGSPPRTGSVRERKAADLAGIAIRGAAERIPTLAAFLGRIAGRVPLVIEIKSRFDNDLAADAPHARRRFGLHGPGGAEILRSLRRRGDAHHRRRRSRAASWRRAPTTAASGRSCRAISATTWRTSCISARPSPTSCPGGSATCPAPRRSCAGTSAHAGDGLDGAHRGRPAPRRRSMPTRWCSRGSVPIRLRP